MGRAGRGWWWVGLLGCMACADGGLRSADGTLSVTPQKLDFGAVALSQDGRATLTFKNLGRAQLLFEPDRQGGELAGGEFVNRGCGGAVARDESIPDSSVLIGHGFDRLR